MSDQVRIEKNILTDIVDSVNKKTNKEDQMFPQDISKEIDSIVTVKEGTTDANAVEADIFKDQTAYVKGSKVTGTMADGDAPTAQYGRENPILTLTPDKIEIEEGDTMPQTVNIETNSEGVLSAASGNIDLVSASLSGKILTVTPSGSGSGKTKVDVSLTQAEQFRRKIQSLNVIITPPPALITEWGDEVAVGDDSWWNSLKTNIISASPNARAKCLGKTKRVSLFSPVLGSNQVLMRCVGYDLDGSKTLTFAAVSTLAQTTQFGPDAVWIGSTARAKCQEFYNACSAKNAILTVRKGTCPNIGSGRNASVTYNDETVFLMSERELGLNTYSPISTENSNINKAECTKGYNDKYQYFTNNNKRIFKLGDANGDATGTQAWPWERSRRYDYSDRVCYVYNNGTADSAHYGSSRGVLPAFAVGQA